MKPVFTISSKGEHYSATVFDLLDGSYCFTGDFDVDIDGSPNWRIDPCGQPDTTLHYNGKPINSDEVPGIVLPPECIKFVRGVVLGCYAEVVYHGHGPEPSVVFDVGPHNKLGEGSPELARRLHINPDPNRGGVDAPVVTFRWWPDRPAVIDGITYKLRPYNS